MKTISTCEYVYDTMLSFCVRNSCTEVTGHAKSVVIKEKSHHGTINCTLVRFL